MQTGDLIFTQLDGPIMDAISDVTEGYQGARVNHVGIIVENTEGKFVLEAYHPEVCLTAIDEHIERSQDQNQNPRYMLGRLQSPFTHLIPAAIEYGLEHTHTLYDPRYLTTEAALYCSELILEMFKHANGDNPFFKEIPMNFKHLETGELHDTWINYYASFGMYVPEEEPGSNPADLSKDERLDIYQVVGDITGYQS